MRTEKFEIQAQELVQSALDGKDDTARRNIVRALARVLAFAVNCVTEADEDGGAELRDEASDTLYGANKGFDFIAKAFADGGVPVIDYEDFQKNGGEL